MRGVKSASPCQTRPRSSLRRPTISEWESTVRFARLKSKVFVCGVLMMTTGIRASMAANQVGRKRGVMPGGDL